MSTVGFEPVKIKQYIAQQEKLDREQEDASIASHKFCARFWQFDIRKYGIYADL
jgi:hypothetical protein